MEASAKQYYDWIESCLKGNSSTRLSLIKADVTDIKFETVFSVDVDSERSQSIVSQSINGPTIEHAVNLKFENGNPLTQFMDQIEQQPASYLASPGKTAVKGWSFEETHSKTCNTCNGGGKNRCTGCSGSGTRMCSGCGGQGRTRCTSCGGRGYHSASVPVRDGFGNTHYREQRSNCYGCSGGMRACTSCGGQRTVRCTGCSGTGKVSCSSCKGSGQVISKTSLSYMGTINMVSVLINDPNTEKGSFLRFFWESLYQKQHLKEITTDRKTTIVDDTLDAKITARGSLQILDACYRLERRDLHIIGTATNEQKPENLVYHLDSFLGTAIGLDKVSADIDPADQLQKIMHTRLAKEAIAAFSKAKPKAEEATILATLFTNYGQALSSDDRKRISNIVVSGFKKITQSALKQAWIAYIIYLFSVSMVTLFGLFAFEGLNLHNQYDISYAEMEPFYIISLCLPGLLWLLSWPITRRRAQKKLIAYSDDQKLKIKHGGWLFGGGILSFIGIFAGWFAGFTVYAAVCIYTDTFVFKARSDVWFDLSSAEIFPPSIGKKIVPVKLNLRMGPHGNARARLVLAQGTEVQVLGAAVDGWLPVMTPKGFGWVFEEVFQN